MNRAEQGAETERKEFEAACWVVGNEVYQIAQRGEGVAAVAAVLQAKLARRTKEPVRGWDEGYRQATIDANTRRVIEETRTGDEEADAAWQWVATMPSGSVTAAAIRRAVVAEIAAHESRRGR